MNESPSKSEENGDIVKNSILPTPRKAIPKGAVAKAKAALLDSKKAEVVIVETDKQKAKRLLAEARMKAEEEEALAKIEREKERMRQEAEEAKLPELQRKFMRRERMKLEARREYEEMQRKRQLELEAQRAEENEEEDEEDERSIYDENGDLINDISRGSLKKQSSMKMKELMNQFGKNANNDQQQPPLPSNNEEIPIIFIISDDDRLKPYGPVIEYNGQDAFEIGASGSVVAPLDAMKLEYGFGQYVFKRRDGFNNDELESADENTQELSNRLLRLHGEKLSSSISSFDESMPSLHQQYHKSNSSDQVITQEILPPSSSQPVNVPPKPPAKQPLVVAPERESRRRSSSGIRMFAKKSATELIASVAEEGIVTVDFSSNVRETETIYMPFNLFISCTSICMF